MLETFIICMIILIGIPIAIKIYSNNLDKKLRKMSPAELRGFSAKLDNKLHGAVSSQIVCPHCYKTGNVRTKAVRRKKGISGGKAAGALITGGLSIVATGLSREESKTEAHCSNCKSTWDF
jgi:hypothetical protein